MEITTFILTLKFILILKYMTLDPCYVTMVPKTFFVSFCLNNEISCEYNTIVKLIADKCHKLKNWKYEANHEEIERVVVASSLNVAFHHSMYWCQS